MAFCPPYFGISPDNKRVSEEERRWRQISVNPLGTEFSYEKLAERLKRSTEVMTMEWGRLEPHFIS